MSEMSSAEQWAPEKWLRSSNFKLKLSEILKQSMTQEKDRQRGNRGKRREGEKKIYKA